MSEYVDDLAATSIVEVTWKDHVIYTNPSWRDVTDELKPAIIKSVGYVLRYNDDGIELAETLDAENPIGGNHRVILKNCITDIKVLNGTTKV